MKIYQAVVKEEDNGTRVWKFVLSQWKAIVKSREQMRRCFKRGEVSINGATAEVTRILSLGDLVQINFDGHAAHESIYGREKLDVRYEDDELAVVVKPSGKTMVSFSYMLPFSLSPSTIIGDAETQAQHKETSELECLIKEQGRDNQEEERDDDDGDDYYMLSNISPTLGQQHRLPCAVIVARTMDMRSTLLRMHGDGEINRTFRVICHGAWTGSEPGSHEDTAPSTVNDNGRPVPADPATLDAYCISDIEVVKVTSSNEAGSISTLDVTPHSPYMGVNVRRYLMAKQHPVVGESGNTKPLKSSRGKGLMSALVRVAFVHPTLKKLIDVHIEEPFKFEQLRNREQKASQRRQESDQDELRKGGLDPLSTYDRMADRPIAYMVGEKDFFDMRFKVSPATLIPRSSTETLVQAGIARAQNRAVKILDVGTGSGCLLLALLMSLPSATGVGVDISQEALEIAQANSVLHDLVNRACFQVGDMGHLEDCPGLSQSFDLVVCNPPYLDSKKVSKLTKTFAGTEYEPPVALFADQDGFGAYELLAACLLRDLETPGPSHIVSKNGYIILEIGSGMGQRVREIFKFLVFEGAYKDKQDTERCLVFAVPGLSLEQKSAVVKSDVDK
ncbi:hypothetical protein BGZ54_006236 [Gamsiella multidivaricata]|nr:hypothetical protein BGZ54_006236 [Gamsiella multidivaricata]